MDTLLANDGSASVSPTSGWFSQSSAEFCHDVGYPHEVLLVERCQTFIEGVFSIASPWRTGFCQLRGRNRVEIREGRDSENKHVESFHAPVPPCWLDAWQTAPITVTTGYLSPESVMSEANVGLQGGY
jgi:hypothetical protein